MSASVISMVLKSVARNYSIVDKEIIYNFKQKKRILASLSTILKWPSEGGTK